MLIFGSYNLFLSQYKKLNIFCFLFTKVRMNSDKQHIPWMRNPTKFGSFLSWKKMMRKTSYRKYPAANFISSCDSVEWPEIKSLLAFSSYKMPYKEKDITTRTLTMDDILSGKADEGDDGGGDRWWVSINLISLNYSGSIFVLMLLIGLLSKGLSCGCFTFLIVWLEFAEIGDDRGEEFGGEEMDGSINQGDGDNSTIILDFEYSLHFFF